MRFDGLRRIVRTSWVVATVLTQQGRDANLICLDQTCGNLFHQIDSNQRNISLKLEVLALGKQRITE
jgi:hypothetical protein